MLNSSSSSSKHNHESSSISARLMLQLAAAVEQQATHPVGKALVAAAAADRDNTTAAAAAATSTSSSTEAHPDSRSHQQHHHSSSSKEGSLAGLESAAQSGSSFSADAGSFLQEPGSGAVAVVAGHRVSVGTLEWVQRQGAVLTPEAQHNMQLIQQQQQQQQKLSNSSPASKQQPSSSSSSSSRQSNEPLTGHTQVFVGVDGAVVGLMDVADMIRGDARSTIQELQQLGLRTVMLSGDRQESALKVRQCVTTCYRYVTMCYVHVGSRERCGFAGWGLSWLLSS
jgi:Cu2+-exporting ATPase